MRKFKYSKLVRDKIVGSIIKDKGRHPSYHKLNDQEFLNELKKKLLEEAKEVPSTSNNNDLIEKLADVQEVIDCLLETLEISKTQLKQIQQAKKRERGSFKKRYFVDHVEEFDDSPWIDHYLTKPDKYPEIKD